MYLLLYYNSKTIKILRDYLFQPDEDFLLNLLKSIEMKFLDYIKK